MKNYIGVKLVGAKPMTYEDWMNVEKTAPGLGHEVPREGYMVQYPDGHKSWCPKEAFEKANLKLEDHHNTITQEDVRAFISEWETSTLGDKTTLVRATLKNGFEIVESSACVDAKNYDQKMGEQICMQKIEDRVWHLLGFLLQCAVSGLNRKHF